MKYLLNNLSRSDVMKKLIILLTVSLSLAQMALANEIDTLWYRTMGAGAQDVDFTPDDKYVIAWANGIEFWEVQEGVKEFFIPSEATGDFNYNEEYLVFAQDSTPKLLNWQTREVVEGFEKMPYKIDRIKTAKSKNEFMAKLSQDSNIIYFWDINTKQIVDNIKFGYSFEKDSYKWKRTVHEYGYVGSNDELIYVIIDDANDVLQNIPAMFHEQHYYVNFYNRETKELVDSVYSFTNTNEQFGGFNKMQVMNNRNHIAWNHRGGEINYYDIKNKRFYNKLVFDNDEITATEIQENKAGGFICITNQHSCCFYLKIFSLDTKDLIHEYNGGSWQNVSFSNNDEFLVTNIGSFLILFPSHTTPASINNEDNDYSFIISPNPATKTISISFNYSQIKLIKLSVFDLAGNQIAIIEDGLINTANYQAEFDVSNLVPSTYFIRLEIGDDVITKQFIKE